MKKLIILLILMVTLLLAQTAGAAIVTNGGFEDSATTFSGWVFSGDGFNGIFTGDAHSAPNAAFLGQIQADGLGTLQQVLTTPAANTYTLSFWLAADGNTPSEFKVLWNGVQIADLIDLPDQPYTEYTFSGLTSPGVSIMTFNFMNDQGFFYLDDVSVEATAVPLPPSALLLGSGLLGLVGLRRRFKK